MKNNTFLAILWIALLTGCTPKIQTDSDVVVLRGATAFDGNGGVVANSLILVREGKIASIGGPDTDIPDNARE
ncbi:MAG: hypothetical protein KJN96_01480, partial [Eudoraea sp.]|nr:hypothetical protein [Eudoraea sp.]